ncbi:MAG TPA: hypothetical protein VGL11_21795 [Candidatus Binatia bacterium]
MSRSLIASWTVALLLAGGLLFASGATATDPACITDSTPIYDASTPPKVVDADLIDSAPCGVYNTVSSRFQRVCDANNVCAEVQVSVPYMKHEATGNVKAIAVLLAGGDGEAHLTPDSCINNNPPCDPVPLTHSGGNFLVRSAQLFAERGFRALTIDQPSPLPSGDTCGISGECYDVYRVSQRHSLDIAAVVRKENPGHKPVFLVGTSRGTESAVAQNVLGVGSMLSSPVTLAPVTPATNPPTAQVPNPCDANHKPYVDDCYYGQLKAPSVTVPVQILMHEEDPNTTACYVATVQDAQNLRDDLKTNGNNGVGVDTFFHQETGGFEVVDPNTGQVVDACGHESFHGFLGIESEVVHRIDRRMTLILQDIANTPDTTTPISGNATRTLDTSVQTSRTINLANLASDADNDPLTFALPGGPHSARGAVLSLSGAVATYDTTGAAFMSQGTATVHDAFVYVTSDGKGRKSFGVVKVTVTVP